MRPPEMERSTIEMWVQCCPSCGYCLADISAKVLSEEWAQTIRSESYQQQLKDPDLPQLANRFLCQSLLAESAGRYEGAGWASINASWACDDAKSDSGARRCRNRAAALFRKAKDNNQAFFTDVGAEEALMADLLRRSGQFELALSSCEEGLKRNPDKTVLAVLQFEKKLIQKSDAACHTVTEATGAMYG